MILNIAYVAMFVWQLCWSPAVYEDPVIYGVFRNDALIAETTDTTFNDTLYADGRNYYDIGVRAADDSVYYFYSDSLSGTIIDLRQGVESYRTVILWNEDIGTAILFLPSGNWLTYWMPAIPEFEIHETFTAIYEFDFNRDGIINPSDFGAFCESDLVNSEECLKWFQSMYMKQSVFQEVY